jgi:hypothetical protein
VVHRRDRRESKSSLSRFQAASSETNNWKAISSNDEFSPRGILKPSERDGRPSLSPKKPSFTVLGQNERDAGYSYGYSEREDDDVEDEYDDPTDGDLGYTSPRTPYFVAPAPPGLGASRRTTDTAAQMVGRDAGGIGNQSGVISRTMLLASGNAHYDDPCERIHTLYFGFPIVSSKR